ncbi:hypothetical protein HPB47_007824 [Ixodes persulcatus]|uniref:Uncharacterized protein n=1 Tax=Ixodes persulcatus TaxID=34615 RepID=A0AC60P6Q1_IXOPE|nr:hypothetical protein HPB47_007824 [Ixodes persulcatus]
MELCGIRFEPGVLGEVFRLLEKKVAHLKSQERKCVLLVDEMAIVPKFEYNPSTSSIRGHVKMRVPGAPSAKPPSTEHAEPPSAEPPSAEPPPSVPPAAEPPAASHALVYMVAGVSSRWKQVVCYQYTGSSFSGEDAASEVSTLIERCHSVGLQVVAITSNAAEPNISGNRGAVRNLAPGYQALDISLPLEANLYVRPTSAVESSAR